ncbi:MAG TPA: hypothetical protein VG248_02735 [Caulobacteraceae bacterium]|jgi:hypothetical protein|nr:hypothetical protein [Caulobacteraceae bacterium]
MRLRIERDPAFWTAIASHPACAGALLGVDPEMVGKLAGAPGVLPLAAKHGGFMFVRLDPLGFVAELHTLFTPEGWGREVHDAAAQAMGAVWLAGYALITACEAQANPLSQPPRSFGFRPAGPFKTGKLGAFRPWAVSLEDWKLSPAGKRRARSMN